jgi:hypothetical protein
MAKVVVKALNTKAESRKGAPSVTKKRVRGADGKITTLRTINLDSRSFGSDLTYVFERNVAKARRENKKVTGTSDGVVKR